mgnify:CR=1 FL=1
MTISDLFLQERITVSVLPAAHIARAYSYAWPEGLEAPQPGQIVRVPVNNRVTSGVVIAADRPEKAPVKLKEVLAVSPLPPLTPQHLSFIDKVAAYTLSPAGAVLSMSLTAPDTLFKDEPAITAYIVSGKGNGATVLHEDVLSFLKNKPPQSAARITEAVGCSAGVLQTMVKKGLLEKVSQTLPPPCAALDPEAGRLELSDAQQGAAEALAGHISAQQFSATLLDGVTGSGKTEVYFEAVAAALAQDQQVLILLPEIALSHAFIERFERRFGCAPALWHSALSPAQRRRAWRGICSNQTKVVAGARSALFLPFQSLGLIMIDEEHDSAFKQEDNVHYHARDMAVLRASLEHCAAILASATPSLETMHNARAGRYDHVTLPARYGGASMPDIELIDMRANKPEAQDGAQQFLSNPLKEALTSTLEQGGQSLLFLNRRGYAPLTLCKACGTRMECPRCSAWLVEHKGRSILLCHHCGYHSDYPEHCPSCGAGDSLTACGPGVERIEEEVRTQFPNARLSVLASDLAAEPQLLETELEKIKSHAVDIVIGTQILAKGHHFPKLALVGVVDGDLGMAGGDLRATERTYQLLHQVAGRAGRETHETLGSGRVLIQTWMPENNVMQALASGDRDAFLSAELEARDMAAMPPFTRLAGIIVSGAHEAQVLDMARLIGQTAPYGDGLQVLGPAPAPIYRLRDRYRQRLLVIAEKSLNVQKTLQHWLDTLKVPSAVRVQVDIDPQSFL